MRNVFEIRNVWNCMKSMATLRWLLAGLLAAGLLAQSQQDSAKPETATELPRFVVPVEVVVAPVTVVDRNGDHVDGLGPEQFHLFDNGKEQNIHVDVDVLLFADRKSTRLNSSHLVISYAV